MFTRTFIRTLFNDIFYNNFLVKNIVNFYYNPVFKSPKTIKFQPNMPIEGKEAKKNIFFQSVTGDKIDCK